MYHYNYSAIAQAQNGLRYFDGFVNLHYPVINSSAQSSIRESIAYEEELDVRDIVITSFTFLHKTDD